MEKFPYLTMQNIWRTIIRMMSKRFRPKRGWRTTVRQVDEPRSGWDGLREYTVGQPERYLTTHHERDQETGLDYRGARFYDSDIGRFLSVDPLAADFASVSPYNYVLGNPVFLIDPDGRAPQNNGGCPQCREVQKRGKAIADKIQNTYNAVTSTAKSAFGAVTNGISSAANFVYDKVAGNDDISITNNVIEVATDKKVGPIKEALSKVSKVAGLVLDVAEGAKILNEAVNSETDAQLEAAGQDAAKLGTTLGLGYLGGPILAGTGTVLINNSRDSASVTHSANIDRAAGAFETSGNANANMIKERIKARQKQEE